MLIRVDQFHGVRPRRDPRLLGRFESQEARNARLWSGALSSWRKPSFVLGVGTNALRYSNQLENPIWDRAALNTINTNAANGPDGSLSADKIAEDNTNAAHYAYQSVAKVAQAQMWTGSISLKAAERGFGWLRIGDLATNYALLIVNLSTGAITFSQTAGNYSQSSFSVTAEASSWWRLHVSSRSNTNSTVYLLAGPSNSGTVTSYAGTINNGIYAYGASLRQAGAPGVYRETYANALPNIASIYLYKNQYWFYSSTRADFIKGPIAGDTSDAVYFTGGPANRPSVTYDPIAYSGGTGRGDMPRQWLSMGLPAPATAVNVALQPVSGNVTAVTSLIATLGNQSAASFNFPGVTTDGYQVVPQARWTITATTTQAKTLTFTVRIKRGTRLVAEASRKVTLNFDAGSTATEVAEITLSGYDNPSAGTQTYTYEAEVVAGDGLPFSATYAVDQIKVRYAKTRIQVGAGHPFEAGDFITVSGAGGYESINTALMTIVSTESNAVWVDVTADETYTSGGVWKFDFPDDERQDTGWVVTFITQIGEHVQEGPPSPISALLAIGSGEPVQLTGIPTLPPADGGTYNLTGKRIYRSNVDGTGAANFQFVAELAIGTTSYLDTQRFIELGEILTSDDWIKPPNDMIGLTEMHNGVLAGISKNQVCFSEPFQPQAWPSKYRISISYQPVRLAAYGENLLVATRGKPTVIFGTEPSALRPVPTELTQPCMSLAGLVDMGDYIVYPGDDGLVMVSSGRLAMITGELFTREEWEKFNPSSFIAGENDGRYVCFYTGTDGVKAGFVFDPREPTATWTPLDFGADAAWTDPATGDLYIVMDEGIWKWDAHPTERFVYKWRSKRFLTAKPLCPAYARVVADAYPVDLRIWANKDPKHREDFKEVLSITVEDSEAFVLPDGYQADAFEFELTGIYDVKEVSIASSIAEIQQGGR